MTRGRRGWVVRGAVGVLLGGCAREAPSPVPLSEAGPAASEVAPKNAVGDAAPVPSWLTKVLVATPRVRRIPEALRASTFVMGERWGCARFEQQAAARWQCWEALDSPAAAPRAWIVPWLEGRALQAGPDRLCSMTPSSSTFRCWHRPRRGDTGARELPPFWEWTDPNNAGGDPTRLDRVETAIVGGKFACLLDAAERPLWCLGDDRYGQLGGSHPAPPTSAAPRSFPTFGRWRSPPSAPGTRAC